MWGTAMTPDFCFPSTPFLGIPSTERAGRSLALPGLYLIELAQSAAKGDTS